MEPKPPDRIQPELDIGREKVDAVPKPKSEELTLFPGTAKLFDGVVNE